ncbi:hypothetical protein [Hyphomonas sp.]|uniref:hypothetical protein n=1 Tax=Hyphomonas sp. TaxID=87 RepID=UPI0039189979
MLNDPLDHVSGRNPALPESLRQAVREAEATGRAAEDRAQAAMPFRARLRARDAVRPQPTLSILTHSGPITAGPVSHTAISEVRTLRREPVLPPPARPAPVKPPPRPPVTSTTALVPVRRSAVIVPPPKPARTDDDDGKGGMLGRIGDFSQFAFAGLAVLGLAGLSVMAAENALGTKPDTGDADTDTLLSTASLDAAPLAVSAAPAAAPATTPWFDYRGTADLLKSRVAALQAEDERAARLASAGAEQSAALAIANAEAARVASETAAPSGGPAIIDARVRDRIAAEEAARAAAATAATQLKADQAAALAKVEANRLAAEEAARAAALAAQQQRLADAEAARLADLEVKRLADLEAKRLAAEVEAKRLAEVEALKAAKAAEAKRLAAVEARRAADAEAARLAALETQRAAKAAEVRRLADLEARRLADAEAARLKAAAAASAVVTTAAAEPAPRVFTNPPGRASLKPVRPAAPKQLVSTDAAVSRPIPPSLKSAPPEVRPLTGPRPVDDFIAERAEFTAGRALDADGLAALRTDFLALVETSPDGAHHQLLTPDGRSLLIHFERTLSVDAATASVHAIGYRPMADGFVTRAYLEPVNVNVKIMCRDVAYAFPGQERGRFAACQGTNGAWTMARASMPTGTPI